MSEKPLDVEAAYAEALTRIEACRERTEDKLDLRELGLRAPPPEIAQLTALTEFRLPHSQVTALPLEIGGLTALTVLDLEDNQLTTLAPETRGIALDTFKLPCPQGPITVRLWDFAGQEITQALHKFFVTGGCVYVMVLDPRSNTEMQDAEYWLGLIRRYAAGAPVLMALNRQDARHGGYDVDRRALQERFPFLRDFTPINCETRDGCDALLRRLCDTVDSLADAEPPRLRVPETWLEVMKDCEGEENSRPHLTLDEFREICTRHGERDPSKQESLARLLHKLPRGVAPRRRTAAAGHVGTQSALGHRRCLPPAGRQGRPGQRRHADAGRGLGGASGRDGGRCTVPAVADETFRYMLPARARRRAASCRRSGWSRGAGPGRRGNGSA